MVILYKETMVVLHYSPKTRKCQHCDTPTDRFIKGLGIHLHYCDYECYHAHWNELNNRCPRWVALITS